MDDLKSNPKVSFQKLFTVGTMGWMAASLILFGLAWPISHPETISTAVLWATARWWIAFPVGFLCLVGYAIANRSSLALAARAYVLPMAIISLIALVCERIYPDGSFRADLMIFLPVVLIFYIFACLWMALTKDKTENSAFAQSLIPTIGGGLMILGFVAVPVFTSNEFRYRNTFQFKISKVALNENSIVADGSIQINEAGHYDFVTPRYFTMAMETGIETDPTIEVGTITWGSAGAPKADSTGVFPMQITWNKKLLVHSVITLPDMEDCICIEVRNPENQDKSIYSLSAEVPH
jgi:hypothetical protein